MSRYPSTGPAIAKCKRWIRHHLLPKGSTWVRVRSGLSSGMTMRLSFPEEAGVWRGEHEPDVQNAIATAVQPGWVVFDIGAAIGTFALGTARLVGDTGRVIAFDGDTVQADRLREHLAANTLEKILHVVHAAVWSHTSSSSITFRCGTTRTQGGIEFGGVRPILANGELIEAPVTSLDAYIEATRLTPQLIKIDVEGAEIEVLRGGKELFMTNRPLIIAEIHTENARDAAREWMRGHAYSFSETILYDPVPIRLLAWPKEQDPGPWSSYMTESGISAIYEREQLVAL